MMQETTIAAISTPTGSGGIGMVRMSGPEAFAVGDTVFRARSERRLAVLPGFTALLGTVFDGGEPVDEVVATVYRAPKSYTGEDVVEFSCHGGTWVTARVLRLLLDQGAQPAGPGEFTKRAFLNGRIDLMQAESVMEIIAAENDAALRMAGERSAGKLSTEIGQIVEKLLAHSAHLAAWCDYSEEGIADVDEPLLEADLLDVKEEVARLLGTYDNGKLFTDGIRTAIVGRPNVGKSTLMNRMTGEESSIVTEIPGTTRDIVSQRVRVGDLVLHLSDTAGLRSTDDPVERIGVDRARSQLEQAQLVLAVFDHSQELTEEDRGLLESLRGRPFLALVNKADLDARLDLAELETLAEHVLVLSAETGEGYDRLPAKVAELVGCKPLPRDSAVVANERQRGLLVQTGESVEAALAALRESTLDAVAVCMDEALDFLLQLSGERAGDRVLDEVFARFCVGK